MPPLLRRLHFNMGAALCARAHTKVIANLSAGTVSLLVACYIKALSGLKCLETVLGSCYLGFVIFFCGIILEAWSSEFAPPNLPECLRKSQAFEGSLNLCLKHIL